MRQPVTVIIPTIESRISFLMNRCLPSVYANRPSQIIIVGGDDWNGNEKRNFGAKASNQPYLLCVDDDSTIEPSCIQSLLEAIEKTSADVAYCGYRYIVEVETTRKFIPKEGYFPGKWSYERLKLGNFIDTTSLIRTSSFPGFDPSIKRFQDWDLWLTMASKGLRGTYVPMCLVNKHTIDDGISVRIPEEEAMAEIKRKHNL